nr:MAG TPA: Protein of unknown function (DUF551) [Caudoviricetes sp.]
MAHDFLGNELSIGDDVVFLNYNGTSANLERGKITRVSEHTAEISGKRRAEYKIVKVNPVKPTMDNTWIPCSERLPESNLEVLVIVSGKVGNITLVNSVEIGDFDRDEGWILEMWPEWEDPNVTHWMPLPELPKGVFPC